MANTELTVAPRAVLGKKVAALRRRGQTPANVYGHGIASTAVQAETAALLHLLRGVSRNQIINLRVEGEGAPRTVVVRDIARDPVNDRLLHVDFYQVSMTERMRAQVPVVLVGTSDAVSTYQGVLLQMIDQIEIDALPGDIPAHIECDVSVLTQLEQSVHVRDLPIDREKIHVHTDPDVVVARVASPRLAAEEEAAAPAEGEAVAAAPAEGEQPQGEAPASS
jgi:large subunit ribosomal protein L25